MCRLRNCPENIKNILKPKLKIISTYFCIIICIDVNTFLIYHLNICILKKNNKEIEPLIQISPNTNVVCIFLK